MTRAQIIEELRKNPNVRPEQYAEIADAYLASSPKGTQPERTHTGLQSRSNPAAVENARLLQAYAPEIDRVMQEGLDRRVQLGVEQMEKYGYDPTSTHYKPQPRQDTYEERLARVSSSVPDANTRRAGTFSGRSGANALSALDQWKSQQDYQKQMDAYAAQERDTKRWYIDGIGWVTDAERDQIWKDERRPIMNERYQSPQGSPEWYEGAIADKTRELDAAKAQKNKLMPDAEQEKNRRINEWTEKWDAEMETLGANPTKEQLDEFRQKSRAELDEITSPTTSLRRDVETANRDLWELNRLRDVTNIQETTDTSNLPESVDVPISVFGGSGQRLARQLLVPEAGITTGIPNGVIQAREHLTDQQRDIITALADKGEYGKLAEYYELIKPELQQKMYAASYEAIQNAPKPMQVAGAIGLGVNAPLAYGQIVGDLIAEKATGEYRPVNLYGGAVAGTRLAQEAQAASMENLSPTGKFLAGTGYSMLQSASVMPFGPVIGPLVLGASAAGQQAIDTTEKGYAKGTATLMGTLSGATEFLAERIPFKNLFGAVNRGGIGGAKTIVLEVMKQAGIEAAEELATEIANHVSDMLIMGADSDYTSMIQELRDGADSDYTSMIQELRDGDRSFEDARRMASRDTWKQFGLAAAGGFLSGGLFGGLFGAGGQAVSALNSRADARSGTNTSAQKAAGERAGAAMQSDGQSTQDAENVRLATPQDASAEIRGIIGDTVYNRADETDVRMLYDALSDISPDIFPADISDPQSQLARIEAYESQDTKTTIADPQAAELLPDTVPQEQDAPETVQPALTQVRETARNYTPNEKYTPQQISRIVADSAQQSGVNHMQALEMANVAARLGVNTEYQNLGDAIGGHYDAATGTVIINADTKTPFTTVFAHELVHHTEQTGAYSDLRSLVMDDTALNRKLADAGVTFDQYMEQWARMTQESGIAADKQSAERDFVADFIARQYLNNADALSGIVAETATTPAKRTAWRRVLDWVSGVLSKFKRTDTTRKAENLDLTRVQETIRRALDDIESGRVTAGAVENRNLVEGVSFDAVLNAAREAYGELKPGAQYVGLDDPSFRTGDFRAPAKTTEETRTRRTYQTAINAPGISEAARTQLKADVDTVGQYIPKANADTLEGARATRDGYGSFEAARGALYQFSENVRSQNAAEMIALGQLLLVEASNAGDANAVHTITADIASVLTDWGQGVQIWGMVNKLSPEGRVVVMERAARKIESAHEDVTVTKERGAAIERAGEIEAASGEIAKEARNLERKRRQRQSGEDISTETLSDMTEAINNIKQSAENIIDDKSADKQRDALYRKRNELQAEIDKGADAGKVRQDIAQQLSDIESQIRDAKAETQKAQREAQQEMAELNRQKGEALERLAEKQKQGDNAAKQRREAARDLRKLNRQIDTAENKIRQLLNDAATDLRNIDPARERAQEIYKQAKDLERLAKEYAKIAKDTDTAITIPDSLMQEFMNADTEQARNDVQERIEYVIASQIVATRADKLRAWRYFSMLANPKTHLRNILGNSAQYAARNVKNAIGAGLESAFIRDGGERTKALVNPRSQADAQYFDMARADWAAVEKTIDAGGRYNIQNAIEGKRQMFDVGWLERARQFNMNALVMEDIWFLKNAYIDSYAQYLKANKLTDSTITEAQSASARAYATKEALQATYHDASWLASKLNDMERSSRLAELSIGGIAPFKKTPINIIRRGLQYSPVGLIESAVRGVSSARDGNFNATNFINELSAGLTGTGITLLGMWLASLGAVSAGRDDDPERKEVLDRAGGEQQYAVKIGDATYTIDWLAPVIMPFMVGVEFYNMSRKEGFNWAAAADAIIRSANPIFELSMLDGVISALSSYKDGAGATSDVAMATAESYIGQFVPTFLGQVARSIDPYVRSTKSSLDNSFMKRADRVLKRTMAKVPFLSQKLQPSIDHRGDVKTRTGSNVATRLFWNMISPGYLAVDNGEELEKEMLRLYETVEDSNALPRKAPTSIKYDGMTIRLDDEEYTEFSTTLGMETFTRFDELYRSSEYKGMSDEEKVDAIRRVSDYAYQLAKEDLLDGRGLFDAHVEEFIDAAVYGTDGGKDPPDYVINLRNDRDFDARAVYSEAKDLSGLTKAAEKAEAIRKMDLSDDEKIFLYITKATTSETLPAKIEELRKTVPVESILSFRSQFNDPETGEELPMAGKMSVLSRFGGLSDEQKQAIVTHLISEPRGEDMRTVMDAKMTAQNFFEAYAKFAEIDRMEDLSASQKATEYSRWVNTYAKSASGLLTAGQATVLRETLAYYTGSAAHATYYDKYYKLGIKDEASAALTDAITALKPERGKESVSTNQKLQAIWKTRGVTQKDKVKAIRQTITDSGSKTDTFDTLHKAGVPVGDILSFRAKTGDMRDIKDREGKVVTSRQEQIIAYIAKMQVSRAQKDALYLSEYSEKTLEKNKTW